MKSLDLRIHVPENDTTVSGILTQADNPCAFLVLAHGAGANMKHRFMSALSSAFADHGISTLRYNFPYMDHGRKVPDRPPVLCNTVRAATGKAHDVAGKLPLFIGGKSMGGRMSSTLASQEELTRVRGIIFFGFPLHPPGQPSSKRGDHLSDVKQPMLFLQGTRDKLADLTLLEPLIKKLGPRASLQIFDGADHSFHVLKSLGRTDAEVFSELIEVSVRWMTSND